MAGLSLPSGLNYSNVNRNLPTGVQSYMTPIAGLEVAQSGSGARAIGDTGVLGASTATSSNPYSETGAGSASNQADIAYIDNQSNLLRDMLSRTQGTLANGLTNLNDSYNKKASEANLDRSRTIEDLGVKRTDTTNAKVDALGRVDTTARTLGDSLRRILGMASGNGSSAYQLAAPNAVARQATQQRTGVMDSYGKNLRDLDTVEKRATIDYQTLFDDLVAQRRQKEEELRAGVLEQEKGIQEQLGTFAGQKAALQGGGYSAVSAAQKPYVNEITTRQNAIDALFNQFRTPTFNVAPVNAQTPSLRDYTVDRGEINTAQNTGMSDPYTAFLKKQREQL